MKVTIEGQVYDFDPTQVRNRALIDVERATGFVGTIEWGTALQQRSMLALTALVWVVLRENGQPDLQFEDVDFLPGDVEIDDDEEPGKDPTPEEASPPS